ncbi:MAG: hypothetical protein HXY46_12145 [Syntrophaceae bacterium]|nr:hypothetical protein [Syntrophaceae bacterium]
MDMVGPPTLVLPEDSTEAQKVFNSLPIPGQLDIVLQSRGKERIRRIFLSENPQALVQHLPEMEVFLTVKEVGERDAVDLISLTTPEQFQFLLDLDLWGKDQLNPQKVFQWMEILLESGEEKVIQFIRSADLEWIVLLLKKFLRVIPLEEELLEARDRIPLFTLDQHYFIDFKEKGAREVFQPFLEILYRVDHDLYRRSMESVIWELESELEETNYRLRCGRLSDHGFPDFEEALEIYRFVPPDHLALEAGSVGISGPEEKGKDGPAFYLAFQNEGPFFSSLLFRVDEPSERNRLRSEIVALCNKALVAEAIDLSNLREIEGVMKKVFHYLNLGLQYLSKSDDVKAFEILRSSPVQKIFQAGVSATVLLRRKAESILKGPWFRGDRENLLFLDPPYFEKMGGLLRKRPGFYRDGVVEDFRNVQDLREAEVFLESIETIVNIFEKELRIHPLRLKELDLKGCYPTEWQGITCSTILLTSLANQILRGFFRFEAIERAELGDLFLRIFEKDGEGKGVVKMEIRKGLKEWFDSIEDEENRKQHLRAFGDFCLDLLEEEYGRIVAGEEIDPRFVKGLLIRT